MAAQFAAETSTAGKLVRHSMRCMSGTSNATCGGWLIIPTCARNLYARPGFGDTVDLIKRHYCMTHAHLNPTRIVPKRPLVDWQAPHQWALLP